VLSDQLIAKDMMWVHDLVSPILKDNGVAMMPPSHFEGCDIVRMVKKKKKYYGEAIKVRFWEILSKFRKVNLVLRNCVRLTFLTSQIYLKLSPNVRASIFVISGS
jgi:hypothetical protein